MGTVALLLTFFLAAAQIQAKAPPYTQADNPAAVAETPVKPGKPVDTAAPQKNITEPPSGTKPADPANPGENPANPAEPGDKEPQGSDKNVKDGGKPESADKDAKTGEDGKDKPGNEDKGKPEDSNKDQKDKDAKDNKDKKDKTDKDSKDKKNKPGKGGKSGGGSGGPSIPSVPTPPSGAAAVSGAGAIGGGIIGGIFSGGKKDEKKEEKKEIQPPAPKKTAKEAAKEITVSSEIVKAAASVQASTKAAGIALGTAPVREEFAVSPLYSAGPGPKITIMDFDGESGPEFSALLSKTLSADLKVYNPKELAGKEFNTTALNRVSARKIAIELGVEYIVTGKMSKKSETLSIISVYLRDGKTGDIKITDNQVIRSEADLKTAAVNAAGKIKDRAKQ